MITDTGKYYLYRHIRLDKNEPFYIGIGTKKKIDIEYGYYSRAYCKIDRNNIWNKITSKSNYTVEILIESDEYDYIKSKEIEFIALYGRKDLNKGSLCNLTDGGEGRKGHNPSADTRLKMSKAKKGKESPKKGTRMSQEQRRKVSEALIGKSYHTEEGKRIVGEKIKKRWEEWRNNNLPKPKKKQKYVPVPEELRYDRKTFRHSEKTKEIIKEKRAKQVITEEHRKNLSKARKGKKYKEGRRSATAIYIHEVDTDGNIVKTYKDIKTAIIESGGKCYDGTRKKIMEAANTNKKYLNKMWKL